MWVYLIILLCYILVSVIGLIIVNFLLMVVFCVGLVIKRGFIKRYFIGIVFDIG